MGLEPKENMYFSKYHDIAHYYGDYVRWLFLFAGAVIFLSLPLYPELISLNIELEVIGAVLLVAFAALTNPFKRWVMFINVIIAFCSILIFELLAIDGYKDSDWLLFAVREMLAIVFLFSLYFGIKTLRSMFMNQIGKDQSSF